MVKVAERWLKCLATVLGQVKRGDRHYNQMAKWLVKRVKVVRESLRVSLVEVALVLLQ